jgi:ribosomal protein S18 acetylase RimI-like enzyme
MQTVRLYGDDDRLFLEEMVADFQEYERLLEPVAMKTGAEIAKEYADYLISQCQDYNGRLLIAQWEQKSVGYIAFWEEELQFYSISSQIRVSDLYISPDYRGKGLGKILLMEAEDYAKKGGFPRLLLCVLSRNESARAMYLKCGMREYHTNLVKYF